MTNRMASGQTPGRGVRPSTGLLILGAELVGAAAAAAGASAGQNHESAQN